MDAANLQDKLSAKASELNSACDIPGLDCSLPEMKLDLIALEFWAREQAEQLNRLRAAMFFISLSLALVIWRLQKQA